MFLRTLRSIRFEVILFFLVLAAGIPLAYSFHLRLYGYTSTEVPCVDGCYNEQTTAEFTFRWTAGQAQLTPPAHETPARLDLLISAGSRSDPSPTVRLGLPNGSEIVRFSVSKEPQVYSIALPPQPPGTHLLLQTTPFQAEGDPRNLGVLFFWGRTSGPSTPHRFVIPLAVGNGLLVLLGTGIFGLWLHLWKHPFRSVVLLSGCLLALMLVSLSLQPTWQAWPWPAALILLAGLLLTPPGGILRLRLGETRTTAVPLSSGLLAGLIWGGLTALLNGIPILVSGQGLVGLGSRLLALSLLVGFYAALFCAALGLLGLAATLILGLTGPSVARSFWMALYTGLSAGLVFLATALHRLGPLENDYENARLPALIVIGLLSLAVGAGITWVAKGGIERWQARHGLLRPLAWKTLCRITLGVFLSLSLILAGRVVYQKALRDLPLFNRRSSQQAASPTSPNVVLITADSLRADSLGAGGYGEHGSPSPHLDTLAQEGVVFEAAMAPASWPLPSTASLHTSLYPAALGIDCRPHLSCEIRLDHRRTTLAEALQQAGYRTQAYVANPWFSPQHGFAQGFNSFEASRPTASMDLEDLQQEQSLVALSRAHIPPLYRFFERGYGLLFDPPLQSGDGGTGLNQRASRFLRLHRDERFFLWVHYMDTHLPHDPASPFPYQAYPAYITQWDFWETSANGLYLQQGQLTEQFASLYAGEVAELDALIGELLAELDAQGLADRTLVIVTSPNGEAFGEHGTYAYGQALYEEIVRVPLLIRGPVVAQPGQRVNTPVGLVDLMPTVLEIAGAPLPEEAQGHSLMPALQGQPLQEWPIYSESLYSRYYEWKALRQGRYKLIYDLDRGDIELYDLQTDPGEQHDLETEEPALAQDLLRELQTWISGNAQLAETLPRQDRERGIDPAVLRLLIKIGCY